MEHFTPVQKIDNLLNFFATNHKASWYMPYEMLMLETGLDTNELKRMLNKLIKDEYVLMEKLLRDNGSHYVGYIITFEGLLFQQQGGYNQQMINDASESIRLETLEKNQRENANRMTYLTIAIAFGTVIAAIYYSIEIWKYFHCK